MRTFKQYLINELSKKTLGKYIQKASSQVEDEVMGGEGASNTVLKRLQGTKKAGKKLAKEETIDEAIGKLPVGTRVTPVMGVSRGKKATIITHGELPKDGRGVPQVGQGHYKPLEAHDHAIRYDDGTMDAFHVSHLARLKEETIDELSKKTLGSYVKKASKDVADKSYAGGWAGGYEQDPSSGDKENRKANKRIGGIGTATDKLTKEETIDEVLTKSTSAAETIDDFVHSKNKMFKGDSKKQRIKRALGAWYGKHRKEEYINPDLSVKERDDDSKLKSSTYNCEKHGEYNSVKDGHACPKCKKLKKEEVEQIDEAGYNKYKQHGYGGADEVKPKPVSGSWKFPPGWNDVSKPKKKEKPFRDAAVTGNPRDFAKEETIIEKYEGMEHMSDAAHELVLHADNSSQLYHGSHMPIINNLKKKMKKGTYDSEKAKKLWHYHADRAAQDYHKHYGDKSQPWHKMFTTADRKQAAAHWEHHHRDELSESTIYVKNFAKGIVDPRTYVPDRMKKTQKEETELDEVKGYNSKGAKLLQKVMKKVRKRNPDSPVFVNKKKDDQSSYGMGDDGRNAARNHNGAGFRS
jgi:ribosomal protein S16